MDDPKTKLLIAGLVFLAAAFGGAALFFGGRVGALKKENGSLASRVRELDASVAFAKGETARLAAKIKELGTALDGMRSENETLHVELQKAQAQFESLVEEKVYLEDILIHKTKEIEKIKREAPMGADSAARLEEKENEIARLSAQNAVLSSKVERLYRAAEDKLASINVQKIALEETIARARRSIQEEYSAVDLGAIQVESPRPAPAAAQPAAAPAQPASAPAAPKPAVRSGPRKEGRVRAINETHGFVVVDLGKVDGMNDSTVLNVTKDGQRVAVLTVLEVRDVMSACNVKETAPGYRLQVNDSVTIQK